MAGELSVRYNEQYMNNVFCFGSVWRKDRQDKRGAHCNSIRLLFRAGRFSNAATSPGRGVIRHILSFKVV
jgi:hypothetical protein